INVIINEDLYDHEFVENYCVGFDELKERAAEYDLETVEKITWVPKEEIERAARLMASLKPLSLEWGTAIEQTENSFQTCRAIYMIPALLGNWDVPGGFVASKEIAPTADPMFRALSKEQGDKIISAGFPLNDGTMSPKMFAHPYETFDAMKTGKPYKIRGLFANANNSLISMPDAKHVFECLKEIEFFVYMDFFMTPTAEFADIVLPAALWPEIDSFYCMPEFAEEALLTMRKAVTVGECKSDEEFFMELCEKIGIPYGASSQEEILDELLEEMGRRYPEYAGINFEKLKTMDYIVPKRKYYKYKEEGFKTPSGKFELYCERLKNGGADPLPCYHEAVETEASDKDLAKEYPLVLTTGARIQQYFVSNNRQIKSLRKMAPFPLVTMNPKTGEKYGIKEGDWVWIETKRGKITQKAEFTDEIDERVINAQMGWWYPEAGAPDYGWDESNVNVLTPGKGGRDPFSGAYNLRGLLCRISKNPDCKIEERYYNWIDE
ncbi:MAG: molybdopterin-dependent oxidoreductase, partial [Eubacterium sp.]|nr:molybdopterin-dependent oxidoreductase [Eubacterium sp.]